MSDLWLQQGQTPLVWLPQKVETSCVATVIGSQGLLHATKMATVLIVHAICQASTFEFTYDARDFAEEWTKGTENAVQYKDTHTYVCIYAHTFTSCQCGAHSGSSQ